MKQLVLIVLLVTIFPAHVRAQLVDQKITIQVANVTIETILEQLTKDNGISFSYSKEHVSLGENIIVNLSDASISEVMDEVLLNHGIAYKVLENVVVFKDMKTIGVDRATLKSKVHNASNQRAVANHQEKVKREFPEEFKQLKRIAHFQINSTLDLRIMSVSNKRAEPVRENVDVLVMKESTLSTLNRNDQMDFRMPRIIVQKAFENIESNFVQQALLFSGYYQEVYEEDRKAIYVVDAAVNVYDKGYRGVSRNSKKIREKIALRGVRASRSYMGEVFKKDFHNFNSLSAILKWNRIKYPKSTDYENLDKRQYRLDTTLHAVSGVTYVVSTTFSSENYERKVTYHVDALTHTFLKVEYEDRASEGQYLDLNWQFTDDPNYHFKAKKALIVYEFAKYNGKRYLSQCSERSYADIFNDKKNTVEWEFGCSRTFVVTDVQSINTKTKKVKMMDVNKGLILQTTSYDPKIWNTYEKSNLLPLDPAHIEDLESELSLEEQYLENALVSKKK